MHALTLLFCWRIESRQREAVGQTPVKFRDDDTLSFLLQTRHVCLFCCRSWTRLPFPHGSRRGDALIHASPSGSVKKTNLPEKFRPSHLENSCEPRAGRRPSTPPMDAPPHRLHARGSVSLVLLFPLATCGLSSPSQGAFGPGDVAILYPFLPHRILYSVK